MPFDAPVLFFSDALWLQVHYDTWRHPADAHRRASSSSSLVERLLPQLLQDAYADGRATLVARINASVSTRICNLLFSIPLVSPTMLKA